MRFPVYSWFLPLQDALDLPQGFVYTFYSPRDALEPEWTDEGFPDELRKARSAVSVKVWQIEDTYDRIGARVDHAMRACKRAFPMYFSDDADDSEQSDADTEDHEQQLTDPPLVPVTVLEANYAEFRLLPTGFDDDGDLPGHVLESVIEKVQLIQRACSYTNGRPTRQLTIHNLPMHIPFATASQTEDGFDTDGSVSLYLIPSNISTDVPYRTDFTAEDIQRFSGFIDRDEGCFGGFLSSQSEARSAFQHRGDMRATVLACATACEVLLDDLLRHLKWEERTRPEDCVEMFVSSGQPITTLVRSRKHLQPLLKGNWDVATQPRLNAWQAHVAHVRHKTIHGGYRPTKVDAIAALEATDGLHEFLGDLLAVLVHKYPMTALTFFGGAGMESKNLMTKRVEATIAAEDPGAWSLRFGRWRDCLQREVEREIPDLAPRQAPNLRLVAVVSGTDGYEWVLHDLTSRMAARCTVDDSQIPEVMLQSLHEVSLASGTIDQPRSVVVRELFDAHPTEAWVAEHRRLPLTEVMAAGSDFY